MMLAPFRSESFPKAAAATTLCENVRLVIVSLSRSGSHSVIDYPTCIDTDYPTCICAADSSICFSAIRITSYFST